MAYCKMRRDVGYVEELWELLDHADFRDADGPAAELLCYQEKVLGDSRTDLAWYGRQATINRQVHVDLNRRRFERRERHAHGVLVPYHCHEIECLAPATIGMRYPPLPSWWASREATYSNLAELPRVVSYLGSMCENPYSNVWYVAQTEWAANQAAEVVACARAGKLLWLSFESLSDIAAVTLEEIFRFNGDGVLADARTCMTWIKRIDWSKTRQVDRRLPTKCNEVTPVFATGGDWVAWDPDK